MREVPVGAAARDALLPALGRERHERFAAAMESAQGMLEGRTVWHVNSTSQGGGVAELLRPLIATARGFGMEWRWLTIDGSPDFFAITKRIHDHLHGSPGDGGRLGRGERRIYDALLTAEAPAIADLISGSDLVVLHDPQTLGLAPTLAPYVASVIWRCHIGADEPNDLVLGARGFLRPSLGAVDARVFSTGRHVWDGAGDAPVSLIAPSIDPTTPKNQDRPTEVTSSILRASGIAAGEPTVSPVFRRTDGGAGVVARTATMVPDAPVPDVVPLVVQVSRWDRLKDPTGVLRGFVDHVIPRSPAHLVLAGPMLDGVADDPEEDSAWAELHEMHAGLEPADRDRVHLALLPMDDGQENAAMVNALQRRADVVVQKSLAEGFGLTVAEAMWKERPVVASAVGGIVDQVEGGAGVLLDDPSDLADFGRLIDELLDDAERRRELGRRARERVLERFLVSRELTEHAELLSSLAG
jgi:trehalose synthase